MEIYGRAAEAGHVGSYCNMANMYREGKGVPEDLRLAAKCYAHAAEQEVAEAQVRDGWQSAATTFIDFNLHPVGSTRA